MKQLMVLFALLLIGSVSAQTISLSGKPPACTATPPVQAIALGYTKLVYCNDLFSNVGVVDVNNTLNPWFLFYATTFGLTLPAADIANDGTALEIITVPSSSLTGLTSTALRASSYAGNTFTGGFYAEVDAKFDDTVCQQSPNSWPAFWLNYPPSMTSGGTASEFTELDIFEWLNCANLMTVHDWTGASQNCTNSNNHVSITPGTDWNTWGVSLQTTVSGGGTGTINWYFNNVLENTVTYTLAGKPNPAGSCPNGAFGTADTQPFNINLTAGTANPVFYRHLHIWQAP